MKKLNLSQWTSIAEISGMIVVVISLIFVAQEIRQNTDQVKANSQQTATNFVKSVFEMVNTKESAAFIYKGLEDFDSLSHPEKMAFDSKMVQITIDFEVVLMLYRQGSIDENFYNAYERFLVQLLISPGVATWYERSKVTPEGAKEDFRAIIAKHPNAISLLEHFKYQRDEM